MMMKIISLKGTSVSFPNNNNVNNNLNIKLIRNIKEIKL